MSEIGSFDSSLYSESVCTPLHKEVLYSRGALINCYHKPAKTLKRVQRKFAKFKNAIPIQVWRG